MFIFYIILQWFVLIPIDNLSHYGLSHDKPKLVFIIIYIVFMFNTNTMIFQRYNIILNPLSIIHINWLINYNPPRD